MLLLMRLIHVTTAATWAGAAFLMTGFVEPSSRALGPDGDKFMRQLAGPGRITAFLGTVGGLAVVSGLYLYWVRSGGLQWSWITTGPGMAFTIGGLAGLAAAVVGGGVTGRTASRLAQLGASIQAAGGPPTPEQLAQLKAYKERLTVAGRINAFLLIIALVAMALADYL